MKIATYNVNSIRKRLPIVLQWLDRHRPDVLCLQETKVQDEVFPLLDLHAAGYHVTFRGRKSYNGIATLSLQPPERVRHGFEDGPDSEDDRVLLTVIGGLPILNTYVPQGHKVATDRYVFKLEWFARLRRYFSLYLDPAQPAVWLGDLNVAPEPIDVFAPERVVNEPDFHIDARIAYRQARDWGFVDTFRMLHPDRIQYTYWDYFRNACARNHGWRIDHILATGPLAAHCREADVDVEPRLTDCASDHTVAWAVFE